MKAKVGNDGERDKKSNSGIRNEEDDDREEYE